jgi:hypothetical protein
VAGAESKKLRRPSIHAHSLKRTDPAFSPQTYGHSGLLNMLKSYDLLIPHQEEGGHWSVSLAPKTDASVEGSEAPGA